MSGWFFFFFNINDREYEICFTLTHLSLFCQHKLALVGQSWKRRRRRRRGMLLAKMRGGHAWLRANRLGNLLGPTKGEEEEEGEGVSTLDPTCCFFPLCLQYPHWAALKRLHGASIFLYLRGAEPLADLSVFSVTARAPNASRRLVAHRHDWPLPPGEEGGAIQCSAWTFTPASLRNGRQSDALARFGWRGLGSAWKTNLPANSLIKFQLTSAVEIDSDIRHRRAAFLPSARSAQSRLSSAHLATLVFTFLMFYWYAHALLLPAHEACRANWCN